MLNCAAILIFIMCSAVDNLAEPGTESSIRWGALVIICLEKESGDSARSITGYT